MLSEYHAAFDAVFEKMLTTLQGVTHADGVALESIENQTISCHYACGILASCAGRRITADLAAYDLYTAESTTVIRDTEGFSSFLPDAGLGCRSVLLVPILREEKTNVLLRLTSRDPQSFTDRSQLVTEMFVAPLRQTILDAEAQSEQQRLTQLANLHNNIALREAAHSEVTEERLGEIMQVYAAARERELLYQLTLFASPVTTYVFNVVNLSHVLYGKPVSQVSGLSAAQILIDMHGKWEGERGLKNRIHPDDQEMFLAHYAAWNRSDMVSGEVREMRCRVKGEDDGWMQVFVRESPFSKDGNGKVTEVVGALIDWHPVSTL